MDPGSLHAIFLTSISGTRTRRNSALPEVAGGLLSPHGDRIAPRRPPLRLPDHPAGRSKGRKPSKDTAGERKKIIAFHSLSSSVAAMQSA